jgi:hypothetical protein
MVLKWRTHRGETQTGLVFYTKLRCSKCDFDIVPLFPTPTQTKIMQNVTSSTALCLKHTDYMFGPFGRTSYRWKDNIKNYFRETGWDGAVAQH